MGISKKLSHIINEQYAFNYKSSIFTFFVYTHICAIGHAGVWRRVSFKVRLNCIKIGLRSIKYLILLRWNFEESTPPANFNRFTVALMTVFQVNSLFYHKFLGP